MNSPFSGMDPFLEPHWLDVHAELVSEARGALNRVLPEDLFARSEERVAIESEDDERIIAPDVRVFTPSTSDPHEGERGIIIRAPFKLQLEIDPIIERFVRIVDQSGELVTVLEFVSPTNKRQPGLSAYRRKRRELLESGVHVVEVDLVRSGDWRSLMKPESCPAEARGTYRITIRTSGQRPAGYLFPVSLADPLPTIPIPLRPSDQPVELPLQSLLDEVYASGRYGATIDYSRELEPPLDPAEMKVVAAILEHADRRAQDAP